MLPNISSIRNEFELKKMYKTNNESYNNNCFIVQPLFYKLYQQAGKRLQVYV